MPQFKHILFPVDFSHRCLAVQPMVTAMARKFGAKLTMLHVVQIPVGFYGGLEVPNPVIYDIPEMLRAAEQQLATLDVDLDEGRVQRAVEQGDAAVQITAFAENHDADLIMMPTHGYGTFRRLLLGSVTSKVLHDALCSVWTDAHAENPVTKRHLECRSMMCAVDMTHESIYLIRYSMELADTFGAKLRLVHAVIASEVRTVSHRDEEFRQHQLDAARDHIADLQREAGSNLEACLEDGSVSGVIRRAALNHNADLVVIGRGAEKKGLASLRTHTFQIVCDSPCPILRA